MCTAAHLFAKKAQNRNKNRGKGKLKLNVQKGDQTFEKSGMVLPPLHWVGAPPSLCSVC